MKAGPIALIDGNSFYASCEQVFRPDWEGIPLVVLSNNDGAAIARTAEAKALGIKMAAPWFEIQHLQKEAGLIATSANFPLYGDMSNRMMNIISQFSPDQEIYSIDECFIGLNGIQEDLTIYAQMIRKRIKQWLGIPTCVGIGHTYTQAKLANSLAKKQNLWRGVCNLTNLSSYHLADLMRNTPVSEVWGIGKRLAPKLNAINIFNVLDLLHVNLQMIRSRFSVVVERIVRELQGQPCIDLNQDNSQKKEIAVTRSFGQAVIDIADLKEAIAEHVARAAVKLRQQKSFASTLYVFIRSNPHCRQQPLFSANKAITLDAPTADTIMLTQAAIEGLKSIYQPGIRYVKAGVILMDFQPETIQQYNLFEESTINFEQRNRMMQTLDQINQRFGKNTLRLGIIGNNQAWRSRQGRLSPSYTTDWKQLLNVKA